MKAIEIKDLTKYYGKTKGVENLNLDIKEGEVFGFVGPNGAGKSTTIKCIMNLINKTEGQIFIYGKENKKDDISIKELIGYLPSEINLYDDLTVEGIIKYSNSFYKKDCLKKANNLCERLQLNKNKKLEELSFGNLKKVGIVLAMMHDPKILILDEATSGLDPLMQNTFYDLLLEEKKKGTTIFFSSHILSELKKICDRVGIIKDGKLVKIENIEDLVTNKIEVISINSNNIKELKKIVKVKVLEEKEDYIKFMYEEEIDKQIKELVNIIVSNKYSTIIYYYQSLIQEILEEYKITNNINIDKMKLASTILDTYYGESCGVKYFYNIL